MRPTLSLLALALFLFAGLGCSRGPVVGKVSKSYENLKAIGDAYLQATMKNNRPPQKKEDLLPYLKHYPAPEEIFKSSEDGEEYVILWNVDFRKVNGMPILAYEKTGSRGQRYVLQLRDVTLLPEDEFRKAPFPPGHQPPS